MSPLASFTKACCPLIFDVIGGTFKPNWNSVKAWEHTVGDATSDNASKIQAYLKWAKWFEICDPFFKAMGCFACSKFCSNIWTYCSKFGSVRVEGLPNCMLPGVNIFGHLFLLAGLLYPWLALCPSWASGVKRVWLDTLKIGPFGTMLLISGCFSERFIPARGHAWQKLNIN